MVLFLEGFPICREELCTSVSQLWTFSPDCSFWLGGQLWKILGGSKLPFKNGGHCVLGDLLNFLGYPSPDLCLNNPVWELYGQFLRPHGLVSALTCIVNCGTLYRQL